MRRSGRRLAGWALAAALLAPVAAPAAGAETFDWGLPPWAEPPPVPADNPMSQAKVELGRYLFYDRRLSGTAYMRCADCHDPARAFTDGRPRAIGVSGQRHARGTPGLANVGYYPVLTWADPTPQSLERQALAPLFGRHPVEMGVAGYEATVLARLAQDPLYPGRFARAFPEAGGVIDFDTITKALAAFQRGLTSWQAPYDLYRYGGREEALSPAARRGEALFFGERLQCGVCHSPPHFTDAVPEPRFHNTGLYDFEAPGAPAAGERGLAEHSGLPEDRGRFRTPSLRNVALTAPYMHDGSLDTLEAVLAHYAAGGEAARRGRRSPLTSPLVAGFALSDAEAADLIAFLESLTDRAFVEDPRFTTPFR